MARHRRFRKKGKEKQRIKREIKRAVQEARPPVHVPMATRLTPAPITTEGGKEMAGVAGKKRPVVKTMERFKPRGVKMRFTPIFDRAAAERTVGAEGVAFYRQVMRKAQQGQRLTPKELATSMKIEQRLKGKAPPEVSVFDILELGRPAPGKARVVQLPPPPWLPEYQRQRRATISNEIKKLVEKREKFGTPPMREKINGQIAALEEEARMLPKMGELARVDVELKNARDFLRGYTEAKGIPFPPSHPIFKTIEALEKKREMLLGKK